MHPHMQPVLRTLLAILLAHLLGDFPLQTEAMALGKKNRKLPYLKHGGIHLVLLIAALMLFTPVPIRSWMTALLIAIYIAIHVGIDALKNQAVKWRLARDSTTVFLSDQALHLITILGLPGHSQKFTGVTSRRQSAGRKLRRCTCSSWVFST